MAYDESLAVRIRPLLIGKEEVVEKKMFGGVAFMVNGNMSVGVLGPDLIVRIDPAETNAALLEPGVRPFDITGKAMKGWVFVAPEAVAGNKQLHSWVRRGLDWARSLPPK